MNLRDTRSGVRARRTGVAFLLVTGFAMSQSSSAIAVDLPRILADSANTVPDCVKAPSLMEFVQQRNLNSGPPRVIDSRFHDLANYYSSMGSCVDRAPSPCVAIRWDYAFFQMLIETNYITFRKPDGSPGGVPAEDNNFAGIGATVPGKPGEKFKDIPTGVLAHLQHVLMYSLTRIPNPVAKRTRQVQDIVQDDMRKLGHPITFGDLATEWTGTDQSTYGPDMQNIAERYMAKYCGK